MDAVKEAESIGISRNHSVNYDYTSKGVGAIYATMDCLTSSLRCDTALVGEIGEEFILANAYSDCINTNTSTSNSTAI